MSTPVKTESALADAVPAAPPSLEDAVERAQRAFALKQYESAVDLYATALEIQTEKHGDRAPENADLYFAYGKALLEHAIAQSSVLGKEETGVGGEDDDADTKAANPSAFLSFSGDAEDTDGIVPPGGEDVAIDLFAQAKAAIDAAEAAGAAEAEDDDGDDDADEEPEDDFNAAWEVLDLARALFEERSADDEEVRLKLADAYITLGDVSLETEKFEQAIADYEAGLALKEALLPASSRQLAEAHYKLGLVLDLTSGRLSDAITHVRRALDCTDARLSELRQGLPRAPSAAPDVKTEEAGEEGTKGKGKATGRRLVRDPVSGMAKGQIEAEIKELEEVINELKLKLEELASPNNDPSAAASAPMLAARELDAVLNMPGNSGATAAPNAPVNDLTGMVKKKKKDANGLAPPEKRKAEDEGASPTEKKAKVEEVPAS